MRWATDRPAVMSSVKAGTTAFIVWQLNRVACRNPGMAFGGTVVLNGALTAIVANNYRIIAGARWSRPAIENRPGFPATDVGVQVNAASRPVRRMSQRGADPVDVRAASL